MSSFAENVENVLLSYSLVRDVDAEPGDGDLFDVHLSRNGSYHTTPIITPSVDDVVRSNLALLRAQVEKIGQINDLQVRGHVVIVPYDGVPAADINGIEIDNRIYATESAHQFRLWFATLPEFSAKHMPYWHVDPEMVAANHNLGSQVGYISFKPKGREPVEAEFLHNGHEREYEFFVQPKINALDDIERGMFTLAGPVTVPKASLQDPKHTGSLTHLLETLRVK